MLKHTKADVLRKTNSGLELQFSKKTFDAAKQFILSYKKKDNPPAIDLTLSVQCSLETTAVGGIASFSFLDMPDVYLETHYNEKTSAQMATLRGIERFIFWATEGYKSKGDRDIFYIHEALIEEYSRPIVNPLTKRETMMRTGDPNMDVVTMSKIIEGGLNWLATLDIPEEVLRYIGRDMKKLWHSWYEWRYTNDKGDPLFDEEQTYSWDDYRKVHPVCEVCGLPGHDGDPLERMHIVSKGADESAYEFPWNWLHSHHSHHVSQHSDKGGWDQVMYEYPVIKPKILKARQMLNEHRSK